MGDLVRNSLRAVLISAAAVGLSVALATPANASTGTDASVSGSCLEDAVVKTAHDPVGVLSADAEALLDNPGEFLSGQADCVVSSVPH